MLSKAKIIGIAMLAIICFSAGWYFNGLRYQAQIANIEKSQAQALEKTTTTARLRERALQGVTDELASKLEHERKDSAKKEKYLIRQVADYRESYRRAVASSTAVCPSLGDEWVRIHDDALPGNALPNPTGAAPDDAGAALEVITHNYSVMASCLASLAGWQEWWEKVGKAPR